MNSGSGPGHITQDGCAVELYSRLNGRAEAAVITSALAPQSTVLELGAGAGRVTHALLDAGFTVTAVDSSAEMLERISNAETVVSSIEALDLERTFDAVVLGSNLINTADDEQREAFLRTCSRHMRQDSVALIEAYVPERVRAAQVGLLGDSDGIRCYLREIERRGAAWFRATIAYETQDVAWTQTFAAKLLSEHDLVRGMARAHLTFRRWHDASKSWFSAVLREPD